MTTLPTAAQRLAVLNAMPVVATSPLLEGLAAKLAGASCYQLDDAKALIHAVAVQQGLSGSRAERLAEISAAVPRRPRDERDSAASIVASLPPLTGNLSRDARMIELALVAKSVSRARAR